MNVNEQVTENRRTTHGLAIASLVLSILGMLPVLPLIGSIGGIITGIIARNEIRANRERYTGEGFAKAGIILGLIGIGLVILAVIALILFLVPVSSTTSVGPAYFATIQP